MKIIQFVNWFPEWRGFYCFRWHKEKSGLAYIYDWFCCIGFWEIRKWHKLTDEDKRILGHLESVVAKATADNPHWQPDAWGHFGEVAKVQDTKSIKLRDQEWVEEIEKHSTTDLLVDENDNPVAMIIIHSEDWQALKERMTK